MTSRPPPVPPANRSSKGSGEQSAPRSDEARADTSPNPDKKGQQGNTKINTTHQGYQQDR
ncbi:MAG: hypothetical protein QHC90_03980 [Shinella sp.]|nr:hypothetical protein [Shinella sp.]